MLKRLFDIAAALVALLLLAPLFPLIVLVIRLDSPGPALYQARRVGQGGRLFSMYKFRTMIDRADQSGPGLTYQADPRITRLGRLLRKSRIDELPQLFNVLKGDMSLVGPRPEAPEFVNLHNPQWRQVLTARPGICGLTQLIYAVEETAALVNGATAAEDYINRVLPVKLELDLHYIRHRSFRLDLQLLARTALMLIWQDSRQGVQLLFRLPRQH